MPCSVGGIRRLTAFACIHPCSVGVWCRKQRGCDDAGAGRGLHLGDHGVRLPIAAPALYRVGSDGVLGSTLLRLSGICGTDGSPGATPWPRCGDVGRDQSHGSRDWTGGRRVVFVSIWVVVHHAAAGGPRRGRCRGLALSTRGSGLVRSPLDAQTFRERR
jgi:hypothetical protein